MNMKAAHRLRTFTLWTGTLLSVLIAAAFVVSAWPTTIMLTAGLLAVAVRLVFA